MNKETLFQKVCIIEDNPIDALLLEQILKTSSFSEEIIKFNGGVSAFEWYKKQSKQDLEVLPQLIFLDLNMPILSGFELIEKFKRQLPSAVYKTCHFAIVTSSTDTNDLAKSTLYRNILAYIIKPVIPEYFTPQKFMALKEKYFREVNMVWR